MSGPIGHLAKFVRKAVEPIAIKALLMRERLESGVSYHPGSVEILRDPYPKYAQMRQRDPVHRMRLLDGWALTRYKDCDAVLRDHARFSNAIPSEVREQAGLISMLHQDPPEHTRLRALVSQAFTPRAIEKLRFRVEQTDEQLLDAVAG
ncbi:MAG: cytochrome P450, partial [Gemmatimonadetes bacterium]|nr:cytochrome P450 [Gemmatimonadota bacterium]